MRRWLVLVLALATPAHAAPAEVVASAPITSAVTIYHGEDTGEALAQVPDQLGGYALIRETRTVNLPAGTVVVRFPGVAAGMLAESVVLTGLPGQVVERNLDAALMSPRSFYAGWFGRPVTLRRTDAKGRERIEPAVIRSGPDGAGVIETARGFEAVTCGPFNDSLRYPSAPPGLYPTPTLSVETQSPTAVTATVTLTYLAWDYDWRADYTLTLAPDLRHGQLQAWLTLASADVTSFAHADAAVVAGKPRFEESRHNTADSDILTFTCARDLGIDRDMAPATDTALMEPVPAPIMVTAMRAKAIVAKVETVADMKLYRLPVPTTVAARSSKQVMLIAPRPVTIDVVHIADLADDPGKQTARLEIRAPNTKASGLGLALPGGQVHIVVPRGGTVVPVGTARMDDRAVGERVRWTLGADSTLRVEVRELHRDKDAALMVAKARNLAAHPVHFEGVFRQVVPNAISAPGLVMDEGHKVWRATIPAHGTATLHYRVSLQN